MGGRSLLHQGWVLEKQAGKGRPCRTHRVPRRSHQHGQVVCWCWCCSDLVPHRCPWGGGPDQPTTLQRSWHGLAPARLAVGWSSSPPPNESGSSAKACSSSSSRGGPSHLCPRLQGVDREVIFRRSHQAPESIEPYTRWLASDYHGTRGCPVERFCPRQHRPTPRPRSAGECIE